MDGSSARPGRGAIEPIAAFGAAQQSLQGARRDRASRGMLLVGFQKLVRQCEGLFADDGRHRDFDPLCARKLMICAIARSDAAAQSQRPRHTHARRDPRLAKAGRSFIRGIAQHRPDRRALPAACFFGCRNLALIEQARDGADAVAFCGVKLVDPAHDTGLSLVDLIIGGRVIGLALVAIAKRSAGKHAHLALKGAMALPSPRPFQDLRAFIFGDHALKLQQQLVFRRRCPSRANEQDFDAGARELFDKKDLTLR
ncbi:hypothetical protein ACVL91_005961 [Bradyrhizobium elkanii]